jgi:hypothetical protein
MADRHLLWRVRHLCPMLSAPGPCSPAPYGIAQGIDDVDYVLSRFGGTLRSHRHYIWHDDQENGRQQDGQADAGTRYEMKKAANTGSH